MCSERRNLQDELLRLQSNYSSITDPSIRCLVLEQESSIQQKLDYVQEEILRAQKAIVDLDDEQVLNDFYDIIYTRYYYTHAVEKFTGREIEYTSWNTSRPN